jgi:hypothetical protein
MLALARQRARPANRNRLSSGIHDLGVGCLAGSCDLLCVTASPS